MEELLNLRTARLRAGKAASQRRGDPLREVTDVGDKVLALVMQAAFAFVARRSVAPSADFARVALIRQNPKCPRFFHIGKQMRRIVHNECISIRGAARLCGVA